MVLLSELGNEYLSRPPHRCLSSIAIAPREGGYCLLQVRFEADTRLHAANSADDDVIRTTSVISALMKYSVYTGLTTVYAHSFVIWTLPLTNQQYLLHAMLRFRMCQLFHRQIFCSSMRASTTSTHIISSTCSFTQCYVNVRSSHAPYSHTEIYLYTQILILEVYSNAMLGSLNSRRRLRDRMSNVVGIADNYELAESQWGSSQVSVASQCS